MSQENINPPEAQDVDFTDAMNWYPGEDDDPGLFMYAYCPACGDNGAIYGGDPDGSTTCGCFPGFAEAHKREFRRDIPAQKEQFETVQQLRDAGAIGALVWNWHALMSSQRFTPRAYALNELIGRLWAAHLREVCRLRRQIETPEAQSLTFFDPTPGGDEGTEHPTGTVQSPTTMSLEKVCHVESVEQKQEAQ